MKTIKIGRAADNDIVLQSPTVSSHHATVTINENNGEIIFSDHSTNGTWINGTRFINNSCYINGNEHILLANSIEINLGNIINNMMPRNNYQYQEQYNSPAAPAMQPAYNAQPAYDAQPAYEAPQAQPEYNNYNNSSQHGFNDSGRRPRMLPTNRGVGKYILFSILTFGIYPWVVLTNISTEINIAARKDGDWTMNFNLMYALSCITLGIFALFWWHSLCTRIKNELSYRGVQSSFSASDFWLWSVLGSLIIVGPFIFIHKFMHAMNKLNENYNSNGD
jgi:hypothetical protein